MEKSAAAERKNSGLWRCRQSIHIIAYSLQNSNEQPQKSAFFAPAQKSGRPAAGAAAKVRRPARQTLAKRKIYGMINTAPLRGADARP